MQNKKSFWDFNPWDKYGELELPTHQYLLDGALNDPDTNIDEVDRHTFILYGKEEALLLATRIPVIKIALRLYKAIAEIFQTNDF